LSSKKENDAHLQKEGKKWFLFGFCGGGGFCGWGVGVFVGGGFFGVGGGWVVLVFVWGGGGGGGFWVFWFGGGGCGGLGLGFFWRVLVFVFFVGRLWVRWGRGFWLEIFWGGGMGFLLCVCLGVGGGDVLGCFFFLGWFFWPREGAKLPDHAWTEGRVKSHTRRPRPTRWKEKESLFSGAVGGKGDRSGAPAPWGGGKRNQVEET